MPVGKDFTLFVTSVFGFKFKFMSMIIKILMMIQIIENIKTG